MGEARIPGSAAHVQAAVARDRPPQRLRAMQAKVEPAGLRPGLAAHVQAALAKGAAQAKLAPAAGTLRAPHVAAAVARTQPGPALQPCRAARGVLQKAAVELKGAAPAPKREKKTIKQRMDEFAAKRKILESKAIDHWREVADEDQPMEDEEGWHGRASGLDDLAEAAFEGISSRATGAVAMTKGGKILVAGQAGFASSHRVEVIERIVKFSDGHIDGDDLIFVDAGAPANLHAEMIFVWYCLKNGALPIEQVGVKDKGCCRPCSAVLAHLKIGFSRTEKSIFEVQWLDPWETAGFVSPLGKGSGVPAEQRGLA